jgi:Protein of unknown function (DUF669).
MSFITTDYSENKEQDFKPLPTDNYEMIIQSAQERATKNGAESLQLKLVVRNDLDGVSDNQKNIITVSYLWTTGSARLLINTICKDSNTS